VLRDDATAAGPIEADLFVASTGADAHFIVKPIAAP
jgi:hypothetical protein